jgi:NADPH:quinone reductase-like Zn-dependent oxidoreductase
MRAVVLPGFGQPDVLRAALVPTPAAPAGEVLVQVAAVSVGRVLDLAARAGRHPYPGFQFPHVLGAEHAGVIAALGPAVTGWRSGAFLGGDVRIGLSRFYQQAQRVIGVRTGNQASIDALWAEVDRGFRPVLDTTFPLEEAAGARRYLEDGRNVGRVSLIIPQPEIAEPEGAQLWT